MKFGCYLALLILSLSLCPAKSQDAPLFNPENFPGEWKVATNLNSVITATETAVHRQGSTAYSRVLQLKAVPEEVPVSNPEAATEREIRRFIAGYRPPAIPYTSEQAAKDNGLEKFTCLEFAGDLVKKANDAGVPAQIIGIKFEGKLVGHAVAGFPTAEGGTLYFDSTPAAGQISREAHQARVRVGELYTRAGGGELAVVGRLPITEIIPVTKLIAFANSMGESVPSTNFDLVVENVKHVQAYGIEYADANSLQVADDQLAKWQQAGETYQAAQSDLRDKQTSASQIAAAKAAARALAENQAMADQDDPYGRLRMGERYLTGDGVKKNPALGMIYLQQAADQGSPTAIQELEEIARQKALK